MPHIAKLNEKIHIMLGNKFTRANRFEGDRNYLAFVETADAA